MMMRQRVSKISAVHEIPQMVTTTEWILEKHDDVEHLCLISSNSREISDE